MSATTPDFLREGRRARLLVYASGQFVLLTMLAMLVYPGGAVYQLDSNHYLFLSNFFSDLGATSTPSGRSNLASHVLFIIALASVGLALIQFSSTWTIIVGRRQRGHITGVVAQGIAIVAGLGFIGIAVTPWNHVQDAHNLFVRVAFDFMLLYVICMVAMQLENAWAPAYTGINIAYLVLLIAYVVNLFAGPALDTQSGLEFQVAAQKVIVYASVVNLGLQALAIRREALRRTVLQ